MKPNITDISFSDNGDQVTFTVELNGMDEDTFVQKLKESIPDMDFSVYVDHLYDGKYEFVCYTDASLH